VIYTDSRFKDAAEIEDFPNLKRHLDQFNRVITSDNRPYGLHRARNEKFFLGEKIISLRKCAEPCFTFTDFPCYVSQTHIIIKTDRVNMQYLTALLNSRLVRFWLKHRGKMQGENFQVDKEPLLGIPILVPKKSEQERLARITSKVIECKKKMAEVTTDAAQTQLLRTAGHFEEQLQEAIETQYGLDEQERRLLSGA
jgi:adenine-specific DNA-methyltransferase